MKLETSVDWSGLNPPNDPIEPLTAETFVERLNALSAAVNSLARLQQAFREQNASDASGLPETPGKSG